MVYIKAVTTYLKDSISQASYSSPWSIMVPEDLIPQLLDYMYQKSKASNNILAYTHKRHVIYVLEQQQ